MEKSLTLFQRMSYSGINIYVEYLIGMASSILIARAMLPADYGSYSYFLWLVTLATSLVNAGISTGVTRFFAEARGQKELSRINPIDSYLRHIQLYKIGVLLVVVIAVYFWNPEFYLPAHYAWMILGIPFLLYCKILHMYRISMLKGLESFRELAIIPIIISPINFLVVLALYLTGLELNAFLSAYFFATVFYWWLSRRLVNNVTRLLGYTVLEDTFKVRINNHLKVAGLSSILGFLVMSQSEIAFLKWFGHADDVAFFSIAHQLSGAAMLLVPGVYSNILLPLIARSVAENHHDSVEKIQLSVLYLLQMGLLVAVPVMVFAPLLIDFLYGEKYRSVSSVLVWLMGFSVIKGLNATANSYLMSVDRQSLILKVTAVFVVITLTLDAWLIWLFGLSGAIAAYGMSAVSMVVVMNILAFKFLGAQPLWRASNLTLLAAVLSALPVMAITQLYAFPIPSLLLMGIGSAIYVVLYVALLSWLGAIRDNELAVFASFFKRIGYMGRLPAAYLNYCMAKHRSE